MSVKNQELLKVRKKKKILKRNRPKEEKFR